MKPDEPVTSTDSESRPASATPHTLRAGSLGGGRQRGEPGAQLVIARPSEAEPEVPVVDFEPVAGTHVRAVVGEQHVVEARRVDVDVRREPHEPDDSAGGLDPLESALAAHPSAYDVEARAHVVEDRREESCAIGQHATG